MRYGLAAGLALVSACGSPAVFEGDLSPTYLCPAGIGEVAVEISRSKTPLYWTWSTPSARKIFIKNDFLLHESSPRVWRFALNHECQHISKPVREVVAQCFAFEHTPELSANDVDHIRQQIQKMTTMDAVFGGRGEDYWNETLLECRDLIIPLVHPMYKASRDHAETVCRGQSYEGNQGSSESPIVNSSEKPQTAVVCAGEKSPVNVSVRYKYNERRTLEVDLDQDREECVIIPEVTFAQVFSRDGIIQYSHCAK
jgi:hypothetical protein